MHQFPNRIISQKAQNPPPGTVVLCCTYLALSLSLLQVWDCIWVTIVWVWPGMANILQLSGLSDDLGNFQSALLIFGQGVLANQPQAARAKRPEHIRTVRTCLDAKSAFVLGRVNYKAKKNKGGGVQLRSFADKRLDNLLQVVFLLQDLFHLLLEHASVDEQPGFGIEISAHGDIVCIVQISYTSVILFKPILTLHMGTHGDTCVRICISNALGTQTVNLQVQLCCEGTNENCFNRVTWKKREEMRVTRLFQLPSCCTLCHTSRSMAPKYLTAMVRLFGANRIGYLQKQMSNPKKRKIFFFGSLKLADQQMECHFEGPAADVLGKGNVPIDSREVLALR